MKRQGLTDAQVRDNIRSSLTQEKVFERVTRNVKVTDAEVKRYYDRHRSQYEPARRKAFSRVKGLIRRQLLQQKRSDAMKHWWQMLTKDFEGKVSCRNATDCVFLHGRT